MGGLETKSAILYRGKRPSPGFWGVSGAGLCQPDCTVAKKYGLRQFCRKLILAILGGLFFKKGHCFFQKKLEMFEKTYVVGSCPVLLPGTFTTPICSPGGQRSGSLSVCPSQRIRRARSLPTRSNSGSWNCLRTTSA